MSENPIYHYRASDELTEEAWGKLRDEVNAIIRIGVYNWAEVKPRLKEWEEEFKVVTGLPIPSAYRSAKSVLKNAINHGIPFAGAAKSNVEKLVKEKKAREKEELSPYETATQKFDKAWAYAKQHGLEQAFTDHIDAVIGVQNY